MNKIAIPAILVATVMVAGMFAFVPVEQASTVHTSVSSDILEYTETITFSGAANADLINLTCNQAFSVLAISFPDAGDAAAGQFGISGINISTAGTDATTAAVAIVAIADDGVSSEEVLSTLQPDIILSAPADGLIELVVADGNAGANNDAIDMRVMFLTAVDATCDITQTPE